MERNAELSALYPDAVGNIVHVDLADGRRLTRRVDYPLGNAKNRLKDSAVEGKFLALVERIIVLTSRASSRRVRVHLQVCPAQRSPATCRRRRAGCPRSQLNLRRRKVRHAHAKIPPRSFAVFLQVALRREKVRLCQWQRSGLCRCAKFVPVGH